MDDIISHKQSNYFDIFCNMFDALCEDVDNRHKFDNKSNSLSDYIIQYNTWINTLPRQTGLTSFIEQHSTSNDLIVSNNTPCCKARYDVKVISPSGLKNYIYSRKGNYSPIEVVWLDYVDPEPIIQLLAENLLINHKTKVFGVRGLMNANV